MVIIPPIVSLQLPNFRYFFSLSFDLFNSFFLQIILWDRLCISFFPWPNFCDKVFHLFLFLSHLIGSMFALMCSCFDVLSLVKNKSLVYCKKTQFPLATWFNLFSYIELISLLFLGTKFYEISFSFLI